MRKRALAFCIEIETNRKQEKRMALYDYLLKGLVEKCKNTREVINGRLL